MFIVDSHCHLDLLDLAQDENDLNRIIERAKQADVNYMLNVCTTLAEFPKVLNTAKRYPFVSASVGVHPNEPEQDLNESTLMKLAEDSKVVAMGETGLDYFRTNSRTDWQLERFRIHIRAAKMVKKPLIVHTRQAKDDTINIMREEGADQIGGVMHCFTEDWSMAQKALEMGFYISFSGIVTFKNAAHIQDVARRAPIDKILIETDSPYLAPVPHRGKPNEPAYVRHTAEYIAQLRHMSFEEFAEQTTQNFFTLFAGAVRPNV